MYGRRGRIGLLVPSINTTMETEFWRIAPEGVSVHSARIAGGRHGTPEELRSMENASKKAAEEVAMVEPDVVVYGCTSGSFFEGPEWNRKICEQLTSIARAPTVTTAGAMAACLMAGGHKKVDIVTPYVDVASEHIFNQYTIRVPQRDALQAHLKAKGVGHAVYYPLPLHLQPCFAYLGYKEGAFPESERAAKEVLSLPIYPELTEAQRDEVVATVRGFHGR